MVSRMERVPYCVTLTIGPYGSPGICIVNCAISQFTDTGEREST